MASKLTDSKIQGLKAPAKGQLEYSDADVPGLRIRIGTTGVKTFILRKRVTGRIRNITLGRYGPRFGLADARRKARAMISDIEAGKGAPIPKARLQDDVETVAALVPVYLNSKAQLRSLDEIRRIMLGYVLPVLGDRMADTVTRGDVTRLVDDIGRNSPAMARAVHAQLSAFYTWAMPRLDRLTANPCRDAGRPAKGKSRDRVLTDLELKALWRVASSEGSPWGTGLQLLMLTGARRDELFSAERSEFDVAAKLWTIPPTRSKNGAAHLVPLSKMSLQVLKQIPEDEDSAKLYPARNKATKADNGPSGFSKMMVRVRSSVDAELGRDAGDHWTLHDIRRTVATGLQRLGVRFEVTEAVLNHVSGSRGGIAGVYQRHDWKVEKTEALNLWAGHLARVIDN
ncbi:tyrosine-type recombinase/integrase [Allopontixanthobacter sediminis]|uniref:Tyrosine-type recombinase/integrase n=1 Tax=Allopontixanthobacter sediminis TaxID=1689985 RepID=A0A845B2N9_9SPHN|nr:site-specific integrase [Allopontixanthobacter sediminis]MXP43697.1 tyrosine-type recombinase/integrase [Allopontixanthobacter sediminis]